MVVALSRLLAAAVGALLLVAVAIAGIGVAIFCIGGGDGGLSPAHAASLLSLADLRDELGTWFGRLEASGPAALVAALCGAGAILLGLALIVGALVPRRERLLRIERSEDGGISARRRAAAAAVATLAERPRDVLGAKARIRPDRRGEGGRASVVLTRTRREDGTAEAAAERADLDRLLAGLSLRGRFRDRAPRRGGRVV
jgi:hypothetical protein